MDKSKTTLKTPASEPTFFLQKLELLCIKSYGYPYLLLNRIL